MFNQYASACGPFTSPFGGSYNAQFPFNGSSSFGFGGFQPSNWNGFSPFNGFNWNHFNGSQNWNTPFSGNQGFDWNTFYAGCCFGYQNACTTFAAQGQTTTANPNGTAQTGGTPNSFGPFGFFPYGPFPFSFFAQNAGNCCTPNQQAA